MEYSDLYKQTGMHCRFSPDGRYLSLAFQHRLVIRNAETIAVVEAFHTPYKAAPYINDVQWAPTSDLVLTLCLAENKVNVWSVEDKEWRFELQDEIAGIKAVRWAPDGRHLLVWSDFELRLTIWSLVSDQKVYIQYPRLTGKGVDFHPDGKLMAVAQRKDYRDYIGIYEAESWSLIKVRTRRHVLPRRRAATNRM
ncbi:hypothetical protein EV182_001185 [Spiromyces aspiralis]|uniref:Uncharacterized protein n=1 Tax=Spiromyces aspiralis TaxID=68401 RepID=A0ACC1HTH5_9FUNG|nr:hypothetical protein EV182_001185 [Spiromyces aspiralis]